ncbi:DUF3127 domain-containing protein [Vicingaceae bacterium]|nr:DUF3127 domain-containing protein [Vicingaceae bacterium]
MSLAIKGRIKTILDVESGTSKAGKGWRKQSFVVDTGAQYNPDVCFGVFGDEKIDMLAKFNPGAEVEVAFNVSSREYNGKYYHNIDAWKIDPTGSQGAGGNTPPPPTDDPSSLNMADLSSDAEDDDLPF